MAILPKHIIKAVMSNDTSLGEHPAFPPEDEEKFIIKVLSSKYLDATEGLPVNDIQQIQHELSALLSQCVKMESGCKEALEQLAVKVASDIFSIPQDIINIEANIVASIDTSTHRMLPEKTDNFEFDSLEDMRGLSDGVYKRRMVDALVAGAANYYATKMENYLQDLFNINPELPSLYKKINQYNSALLYLLDLNSDDAKTTIEGGKVDVYVGNGQSQIKIVAEGIVFPALLEETIKGVLELAVLHGLPKDRKKAAYIMKKADFGAAEMWDLRLGLPLWERIINICEDDVEPNFLLMELSSLEYDEFNEVLGEVFAHTKKGKTILKEITANIIKKQGEDDFHQYIDMRNSEFQLDDDEFKPEELVDETINGIEGDDELEFGEELLIDEDE